MSVGFETLRSNPLRTILSTLGIVIGVAALVSVLSVGDGMERLAREQIGRTTDLQRIAVIAAAGANRRRHAVSRAEPGKVLGRSRRARFAAVLGDSAAVNMLVNGSALVTTRADTTPHAIAGDRLAGSRRRNDA